VICSLNEGENSDVKIAPISERHIEGYHRCLDSVARERRYIGFVQAPPPASSREFVLSNIQNNVPQFVALKGDEVVGWCDISPGKREGFTHCGTLGMGVLRDHRRHGIGTRLMERTISKAKARGIERVELDVYASNVPAVSLYEKRGFLHEGVKKRARKLDGVYDDILVMALFI
jgi:ribosomal protein S18 acetylase RimI-like enzyme